MFYVEVNIQGLNQNRVDKMVRVTDNWYPCYKDNQVKISLFISNLDNLNCKKYVFIFKKYFFIYTMISLFKYFLIPLDI